MVYKSPLIVTRVAFDQRIEHDGPIIFKVFVPKGVEALALDGGIVLEAGGGENVKLASQCTTKRAEQGATSVFNNSSADEGASGVVVRGGLSSCATIVTDGDVTIDHADDSLSVSAGGNFTGGDVGHGSHITSEGNLYIGNVGPDSVLDSGGALNGGDLGRNGEFNCDGAAKISTLGAASTLAVGGSATIGIVQQNTAIAAGGSLTITRSESNVATQAGGTLIIGGQRIDQKRRDLGV